MSTEESKQEEKSNELYTLSPTVLDEMIEYIEEDEEELQEHLEVLRTIEKEYQD